MQKKMNAPEGQAWQRNNYEGARGDGAKGRISDV